MIYWLICDRCDHNFNDPAALVLSPPAPDMKHVRKFHICRNCWADLREWIDGLK